MVTMSLFGLGNEKIHSIVIPLTVVWIIMQMPFPFIC